MTTTHPFSVGGIIHDTVLAIVDALGEGWEIDPDQAHSENVTIIGPRGDQLRFKAEGWRTGPSGRRFTIGGQFPPELQQCGTTSRGISVDAGRPPADIARDITRRLLPGYREAVAAARCRWVAGIADGRVRDHLAARIALALGGTSEDIWSDHHGNRIVRRGDLGALPHARFSVPRDGAKVEVRLTVAPEAAVQLAALIAHAQQDPGVDR